MPEISVEDAAEFLEEIVAWTRKEFGFEDDGKPMWKDDWTLIVKLHAMIETGLNGALLRELDRPTLSSIIAKLDTSNPSTGKVAFAKALGIIDRESAIFLQKLSELRNVCVHDVRNFRFSLLEYIEKIGPEKGRDLLKVINKAVRKEMPVSHPQNALIAGTYGIIAQLMIHEQRCLRRELDLRLLRAKAARQDEHDQSTPKES